MTRLETHGIIASYLLPYLPSQPAGVGFSPARNGSGPDNMKDAASDFNTFLHVFFSEMFPQFSMHAIHFAGESFGGHWVPEFVERISKHQQVDVPGTTRIRFNSILLFDPVISYMGSADLAAYDHFCSQDSRVRFNETACRAMEETMPECDYLHRACLDTYDVNICRTAFTYCAEIHGKWFNEYGPNQPDPYNDRFICKPGAFACGNFDISFVEYLNQPTVLNSLGFKGLRYTPFSAALNRVWGESGAMIVPTTRAVSYILNDTPVKVLVINGNNDILV